MQPQSHFRQQTSCALLKLAILGGVDERVDEAVAEHQNDSDVVVPTSEVDNAAGEADNGLGMEWGQAHDETAPYHQ